MKRLLLSTAVACGLSGLALTPASAGPAIPSGLDRPATGIEGVTRMGRYRLMRRRIIMNRMRRNRMRRGEIEQRETPAGVVRPPARIA